MAERRWRVGSWSGNNGCGLVWVDFQKSDPRR